MAFNEGFHLFREIQQFFSQGIITLRYFSGSGHEDGFAKMSQLQSTLEKSFRPLHFTDT